MNDEPWRRDSGNVQGVGVLGLGGSDPGLHVAQLGEHQGRLPHPHESHQVGGLGFEAGDRAVAIRSMTAGVMAARN